MAAIDPGEAGAIKSHDHYRASLQVIRRFCLTVSFFAVWVMARQQLDPMRHRPDWRVRSIGDQTPAHAAWCQMTNPLLSEFFYRIKKRMAGIGSRGHGPDRGHGRAL
jgi:hypothetical protein